MNRPGKRVSAERVKPTWSGQNYKTRNARVNKAEKNTVNRGQRLALAFLVHVLEAEKKTSNA